MVEAAIVGLGRWGQNLVRAVNGVSDRIRFTRGVVRNPGKVSAFAGQHGLAMSSDLDAVLRDPGVQAVVFATPNSQHADQVVAAAAAGRPVYSEKPLALTLADARRAVAACEQAGVTLAIGQDKRYWPAMRELANVVRSGALGQVLHVEGHFSNENAKSLHHGWRESPAEVPGASLTSTGIHVLDAFVNLIGPVRRVDAQLITHRGPPEPLDTLTIMMEFGNRVSGVLAGVRATPRYWRVHVFGTDGSAEAVSDTELVLRRSGAKPERHEYPPVNALRIELEAFADAVEGRAPFPIPHAQMLDAVAALEAIVKSMHARGPVVVG